MSLLAVGLALVALGTPDAAQSRMSRTIVWTACDVGSAGSIHAAAIGHAMAAKEGMLIIRFIGFIISGSALQSTGRGRFFIDLSMVLHTGTPAPVLAEADPACCVREAARRRAPFHAL